MGNRALSNFSIAADVTFRQQSFTILLGGTSGCGKSTLASFLASRIGFTTVISTDNIRHMMRSFIPADQAPVLFASTYHAGEVMNLPEDTDYKQRVLACPLLLDLVSVALIDFTTHHPPPT
jgi:2-phosphoglycerate kinase